MRVTTQEMVMTESSKQASVKHHLPLTNSSASLVSPFGTSDAITDDSNHNDRRLRPDYILSSANHQPYDRDWMQKYKISEHHLDGLSCDYRLDALLRTGAIKVGDKLCMAYYTGGSDEFDMTGEVC